VTTFLSPLLKRPLEDGLCLRISRTGQVVATTLELAGDSHTRRKGLLGRVSLASGHAMIIAPSSGIHTVGMRFPLDVLFVSRAGLIVKVRRDLRPFRISVALRAFAAIELAAGATSHIDFRRGDVVEISAIDAPSLVLT